MSQIVVSVIVGAFTPAGPTLLAVAELLGAVSVIVGVIVGVYKIVDNNKRQNLVIAAIQEENGIICIALQGCLEGLIEQGCDGPCKNALAALKEHINKRAHTPNL